MFIFKKTTLSLIMATSTAFAPLAFAGDNTSGALETPCDKEVKLSVTVEKQSDAQGKPTDTEQTPSDTQEQVAHAEEVQSEAVETLSVTIEKLSDTPDNPTIGVEEAAEFAGKPTEKKERLSESITLPSETDVEAIIAQMPDFNGLMAGLMDISKNEELKSKWMHSAMLMHERAEKSGVLEPDENGLPDINGMLALVLRAVADEEIMAPMLDTIDELEEVVEEFIETEE